MDTRKILKIIENLQEDEGLFGFQGGFQSILDFYNQENPDALNTKRDEIFANIDKSIISNYVLTDYKVLEELEINNYYGLQAKNTLNSILESQKHEIKTKLENFVRERQESLTKLESLKNSLTALGIESRILEEDEYEIAFSFPTNYLVLNKLNIVLKDINHFLTALAEACDEEKTFKIVSVNNGSIEIYIQVGIEVARCFETGLKYFLEIYGTIRAYNDIRDKIKGYSKKRSEKIEKESREEMKEKTKEFIDTFLKSQKITDPEKETRVRNLFKIMIKHLEKGVSAEVRTPSLKEPETPAEGASPDEKRDYKHKKELYNWKEQIDAENKEMFVLQQNNFYGLRHEMLEALKDDEVNK